MQNAVEEYRITLQDFFTWLDTLVSRAETADRGRGMGIAQRVALLEQLTAESSQGKPRLAAITSKVVLACYYTHGPDRVKMNCIIVQAMELTATLSNLDGQQVDEQLKVAERRENSI